MHPIKGEHLIRKWAPILSYCPDRSISNILYGFTLHCPEDSAQPDAIDFLDTIKLNLFASEIFVFTPKGDLKTCLLYTSRESFLQYQPGYLAR